MRLRGPAQILKSLNIRTFADYKREVQKVAREAEARHGDGVYIARVEHGRLIADCPCNSAVAVHASWAEAGCFECGRWWPVVIPENFEKIEAILMERPDPANRNWTTGESVEILNDENADHGVPRVNVDDISVVTDRGLR